MKKIIFVVLVLLFVANFLRASNTYRLYMNETKTHTFNTISVNNTEYLDLLLINNLFFNDTKIDFKKFEIIGENFIISFIPSSIFIHFKFDDKSKVFQMRQASIIYNKSFLVPFNSFLIALEVLNIYKVDCDIDKISLTKFMELTPKEHPSTQINMSKNDSGIGDTKSDFKTNVTDVTLNINDTQKEQISNSKIQNKPRKATIDNNEFVANSYFKSEPNVYKLPSDLNRGDLSKDYKEIQLADIKNDSRIALLTTESETKLQIIKIEIEKKSEFTEIHLYANTVIENYQKPDCNGKNMKIRIPGATDKISDLSKMNDTYPINKIGSEIIKNLLIYTVSFSVDLSNCTCKRNGPKELIFTAYHGPINESMNDKNSSDEKKNEVINFDNQKKKWELDVIVLDPGHGGHDVGAVGVSGIYEKDLTLKLAKKVKELIAEKMPNTKVILTREDDRFVELYKRGQIANQAGGKLFISIHLNAAQKKPSPARGVETYILRPGRNDDAIRVANFENSVIKFEKQQDVYKHLNEEQIIIATMAQSAFVQFSEKLAKHVQEEIVAITKLEDRGVKQAGFYVLVGASMPNILFEACFLSNPEDEKFVSSAEGQEKIALGLVKAIKKYSDEYMK